MGSAILVAVLAILGVALMHRAFRIVTVEYRYVRQHRKSLGILPQAACGLFLLGWTGAVWFVLQELLDVELAPVAALSVGVLGMAASSVIAFVAFSSWAKALDREPIALRTGERTEKRSAPERIALGVVALAYSAALLLGVKFIVLTLVRFEGFGVIIFVAAALLLWQGLKRARFYVSEGCCKRGRKLRQIVSARSGVVG